MFKRYFWLILFFIGVLQLPLNAKQNPIIIDSLSSAALQVNGLDTIQNQSTIVIDSITPKLLRPLDSLTKIKLADSLAKGYGFEKVDFEALVANFLKASRSNNHHIQGDLLPKGDLWILGVIAVLLLSFAILNVSFSKQLMAIVQSFFSNRALVNLNKEDNLFTSWPFLLLFVQFGFTIGMFFYLVAQFQDLNYVADGFNFFLTISILIIVLYAFKILVLRLLGFVFNVQKPISEYVSILYLSYFNASLLFMPLVIAFALTPLKYGEIYMAIAIILVAIIFVFQFIRAGVNILSQHRFSKVYLILYFCTLEICPILILIKAIGF